MKKSLILFATTIALATSIFSTPSFARGFGGQTGQGEQQFWQRPGLGDQQFGQRPGSGGENQRLLGIASVLNLTNEQVAEIEAIQEAQKEPSETIREETESARQSLRELLQAGAYGEAEVAALADVVGDLVSQRVVLKSKAWFDISQVLTAEQNAQLENLRKTFESCRGGKPEDTETTSLLQNSKL
jgi:Spy/CpxP family protein refolding chaperone